MLRDGTGLLQAVLVKSSVSPESWTRFAQLTQETSIEVEGEVRPDARAPGGFELAVKELSIYGESPIDYPIQPKEHGIDFLLDNRHFWLRTPRQRAIARIRHEAEQAIRDFFYERDFTLVDTPILTSAIGERSGLFSNGVFRRGDGVSGPDRAAVRRSGGRCPRQDLLFWPNLPRREIKDSPSPD